MDDLDYNEIDRYLDGKMSAEELGDFEQKLATDEMLASAIAMQKDLLKGIELFGDQQLRENIQMAERKFEKRAVLRAQPKPRVISLFTARTLAIAASFLILIVAGYFLLRPTNRQPAQLYANYFQMDQTALENKLEDLSLLGMAMIDKERRDELKSKLELVKTGRYGEAVIVLREHLRIYPQDEAASYFLGLSLMQINSFEEAIRILNPVGSNKESEYYEDAQWFQALSWLNMEGGREEAIQLLTQISEESGPRADQAVLLLKELNALE